MRDQRGLALPSPFGMPSPFTAQSGGAPPAVEPIAYILLDDHNSISAGGARTTTAPAVISQGSPIYGTNGAASLALNGAFGQVSVQRVTLPLAQSIGATDLIMFAVDPPADPVNGEIGNGNFTFNATYSFREDPATSPIDEPPVGGSGAKHGARWISMGAGSIKDGSWAGNPISFLAPGSYTSRPIITPTNLVGGGNARVGPLIRVTQKRKSIFALTLDDNNVGHVTIKDMMLTRWGFARGTSYIATGLIGTTGMSASQMMAMKADGWTFSLDSGPNDEPIWGGHGGTIADAIARLDADRAFMVANGYSTDDECRHLCYSYGSTSYIEAEAPSTIRQVTNATANGTTTVTIPSGTFYNVGAMRGTAVKGAGVPAGTTVVSCPAGNTLILSQPVSSGTNITLSFTGMVSTTGASGNLTANGTTVITGLNSLYIVPGMRMNGRDVPANTTVVSVDVESATVGQITVSQNVPATCTRGSFHIPGAEWLPGRCEDALIAAGYKSGRRTKGDGMLCTQLGIPSARAMMSFTSRDFDYTTVPLSTSNNTIGAIQQAIRDGRDILGLTHGASGFNQTVFTEVLDYIKARMDAGELDAMSIPAWYNRVAARSGL